MEKGINTFVRGPKPKNKEKGVNTFVRGPKTKKTKKNK